MHNMRNKNFHPDLGSESAILNLIILKKEVKVVNQVDSGILRKLGGNSRLPTIDATFAVHIVE